VQDVLDHLDSMASLHYAEDFDNVGLLVGNPEANVSGILITLDSTEAVIDEALENKCTCIVSFHPIIFKGLKSLTGGNYVERTVMKAIKHDIAIIAIHTALDNDHHGVNDKICERLGLTNREILIPKAGTIKKLSTYVPTSQAGELRTALFNAGAGEMGNYSHCSFNIEGTGTFLGNEVSSPTLGEKGELHKETEIKLTMIFASHLESKILQTLFKSHPYEEVAYEVITLNNANQTLGMGMTGKLSNPMAEEDFMSFVKERMHVIVIKHSELLNKSISKVAVLGGSGSFAIEAAIRSGADAYITADLKYHDFFRAENNILLMDIGHYESEQFTKSLLLEYLTKKIPNFAIILSQTVTNPVKYFYG
ncbi:MAG: Nif3-like dinuclear metal center hexameric protein, partial [Bacteroidia bacterium]|nr:Nif3-like dinuclear metal center hexameric protein [Bacteroidia bacterium]